MQYITNTAHSANINFNLLIIRKLGLFLQIVSIVFRADCNSTIFFSEFQHFLLQKNTFFLLKKFHSAVAGVSGRVGAEIQ